MSSIITTMMQWDTPSVEGASSFFNMLVTPKGGQSKSNELTEEPTSVANTFNQNVDSPRPSVASVDFPPIEDPKTKRKKPRDTDNVGCFRLCGAETHEKVMVDEMELLKKGWWCFYCCCSGCGCGPLYPSLFDAKCLCCRQACSTAPCFGLEGCLSCVVSCCCCHSLCQLPPRNETPKCMCCNEMWGDLHRGQGEQDKVDPFQTFDHIFAEAFMLTYCFCCGFAVSSSQLGECCAHFYKCCCCKVQCDIGMPAPDDLCTYFGVCCCVFSQCRCPPKREGNPLLGLCGFRFRKELPRANSSGSFSSNS